MVAFVMMGIVAVIGFLCLSYAIPEMLERGSGRPSSIARPRETTSAKWNRQAGRPLKTE